MKLSDRIHKKIEKIKIYFEIINPALFVFNTKLLRLQNGCITYYKNETGKESFTEPDKINKSIRFRHNK